MVKLNIPNNYRVEKELSRGGVGAILYCTNKKIKENQIKERESDFYKKGDGAAVVVKILLDKYENYEEVKNLFRKEGNLLGELSRVDKYFPKLIDIERGENNETPWIMMSFCHGKNLKNLINELSSENINLPLEYIAHLGYELCNAVGFLHYETDHLHDDLKPENIQLSEYGNVYLLDLGITQKIGSSLPSEIEGTVTYSSPELQVTKNTEINKENLKVLGLKEDEIKYLEKMKDEKRLYETSDIFSIGIILNDLTILRNNIRHFYNNYYGDNITNISREEMMNDVFLLKLGKEYEGNHKLIKPIKNFRSKKVKDILKTKKLQSLIEACTNRDYRKRPDLMDVKDELKSLGANKIDSNDIRKFFKPFMGKLISRKNLKEIVEDTKRREREFSIES